MNIDPMYEKAMNFAKNFRQHTKSVGLSNVYVILRKDKDGNILDEHYGMNLMTDWGMQRFFTTNDGFPTKLYVGNGDGILSVANKTLLSPLSETAATVRNGTANHEYPLYFSAGSPGSSGLITAVCRRMISYLPYTFDSYTTPFAISEYGIGSDVNNLWTHSWVYTDQGARTTVTKNPNEELEFHVYFCMSYYDSMINDAWAAGKHIVITTMNRFFNRMIEDNILRFKRNNVTQNCEKTNTNTGFDNDTHMITEYANLTEFVLSAGTSSATGYMDGLASWSTGFCMVERELKPTTENVDTILYPFDTVMSTSDESLTACFGDANKVPITQMDIQHSYTFDHTTGAYTSEEQFTSSASKWYSETPMETKLGVPIYYTTNNTYTQMFVYQNLCTSDPIIRIEGNVPTVYATDTYWDTSSWVFISDHSNIPVSERNRKYWISSSNSVNLKPVRGNVGYRITQPGGLYTERMGFTDSFVTGICNFASSVSDNIFTMKEYLYDINSLSRYRIYNTSANTRTFIQDGKVILFTSDGNVRVASYTAGNGWTTTTYASIAGISDYYNYAYITNADDMIVIMNYDGKMERMENGAFVSGSNETGIAAACAMMLTDNSYAFIRTSDPHTVHFYGDNAVSETTFNIPSSAATPKFMYGAKNNLYVSDGSSYMYHINTTTGVVNACTSNITSYQVTSDFHRFRVTAVGDIVMVYLYNYVNGNYTYMSIASNPTNVFNINGIFRNTNHGNWYFLNVVKWNDTYVMIENCYTSSNAYTLIYDLSHFIYDGTSNNIEINGVSVCIPFGNRLICQNQVSLLTNYIPHRVTGTTRTITTLNLTKNIRSKQWALTFTNTPTFQGLPPGTQQ